MNAQTLHTYSHAPLYERVAPISAKFDVERCTYRGLEAQDRGKSEYQRRIEAIQRKEKHIVQPPQYWLSARIDHLAKMAHIRPHSHLRPSLRFGLSSDRQAFLSRQRQAHELSALKHSKRRLEHKCSQAQHLQKHQAEYASDGRVGAFYTLKQKFERELKPEGQAEMHRADKILNAPERKRKRKRDRRDR